MKRLLWLGLFFVSGSWFFSLPIFTIPQPIWSILFLILGILCNIFSFWKSESIQIDKRYLVFLIPLIFSIFIINYPYNIGLIILTLGIFLPFATNGLLHCSKTCSATKGMILSGIILSIQTAFFPLYRIFVSHGHRVDALSIPVSFFGNILGLKTTVGNGVVFVQTIQQTYSFTTTWEKLGFFMWLNIIIGAMILFFLLYNKKKTLLLITLFFIISFFYLIIRYVTFIFLYINTLELEILWNPFLILVSFLPLALLLMKLLPLVDGRINIDCFKDFSLPKKQILAIIMIFIFIFCVVGSLAFQDPGIKKNGKILIDEYHSDWEDSTRPLDKEWYGLNSTYNYYSWANWLNYYYEIDQNMDSELTPALLQQYDVLILKCPTSSYSNEEIVSIVSFVEKGGGLYLIGDHTDVFGMNTFLNQISEEFDIRFNMDATYELGTGEMTAYEPNSMISHVIVQNLKRFEFMTSCTLDAPFTSENVIMGNRLIGEPGTYATENFFRESLSSPESEYGLLLQVAAVKYGKGRVVAFSDSTVFSSFSMFSDGYQAFTLGAIEYLNRENNQPSLNVILFGVAIISLITSLYILKNDKKIKILFLFTLVGFLSFSTAAPLYSYMNHTNYLLPAAHTDYVCVGFDQEYSNYAIDLKPIIGLYDENDNYGTFFVWTQRVGCIPSIEKTLDASIQKDDIIVIINPTKYFKTEDIEKITTFVENGGRVLVMDSITNIDSTANNLLEPFGMHIHHNTSHPKLKNMIENLTVGNNTSPYLTVSGGEKLIINETSQTYLNVVEIHNYSSGNTGKIAVFTDSYVLSNMQMGGTFTEPDDRQMMRYNIEFYIFEEVILQGFL